MAPQLLTVLINENTAPGVTHSLCLQLNKIASPAAGSSTHSGNHRLAWLLLLSATHHPQQSLHADAFLLLLNPTAT